MDPQQRFAALEALVVTEPPPTWQELIALLDLPDERWQAIDPASSVPRLSQVAAAARLSWEGTQILWVGIEEGDDGGFLELSGYRGADEDGVPDGMVWTATLPAAELTSLASYETWAANGPPPYDYWARLAWAALATRLLNLAPPCVKTLVGFSGGDWVRLSDGV